jgi:hypothetical protein
MNLLALLASVVSLTYTVVSWFTNEAGRNELLRRRTLLAKKKECLDALRDHRWDDLRRLTDEFERLSTQA